MTGLFFLGVFEACINKAVEQEASIDGCDAAYSRPEGRASLGHGMCSVNSPLLNTLPQIFNECKVIIILALSLIKRGLCMDITAILFVFGLTWLE